MNAQDTTTSTIALRNEAQRLRLLQQMGILSYAPRFILPGAAPSHACPWPEDENDQAVASAPLERRVLDTAQGDSLQSAEATQGHPASSYRGQLDEVKRALGDDLSKQFSPEQTTLSPETRAAISTKQADGADAATKSGRGVEHEAPKDSVTNAAVAPPADAALENVPQRRNAAQPHATELDAEQSVATESAMPFQLLLFCLDKQFAVCAQIPALVAPALNSKEARLLNNIVAWLGLAATSSAVRTFSWPLPGVALNTRQLAGLSSYTFFEQAARELGFHELLLLGSHCEACLESKGQTSGSVKLTITSSYGLSEMLAVPELKHEVWQKLLPLFERLQSGKGVAGSTSHPV